MASSRAVTKRLKPAALAAQLRLRADKRGAAVASAKQRVRSVKARLKAVRKAYKLAKRAAKEAAKAADAAEAALAREPQRSASGGLTQKRAHRAVIKTPRRPRTGRAARVAKAVIARLDRASSEADTAAKIAAPSPNQSLGGRQRAYAEADDQDPKQQDRQHHEDLAEQPDPEGPAGR